MLTRIAITVGIVVMITIIGYLKEIKEIKDLNESHDYLVDYRNKLIKYAKDNDKDSFVYISMHSTKAQGMLGLDGILDKIKFPFENGYHTNIPVLALVPNLQTCRDHGLESQCIDTVYIIESVFLRSIGHYEDIVEQHKRSFKNPLLHFANGFHYLFCLKYQKGTQVLLQSQTKH